MILWKNGYFHSLENPMHVYHQMATDQGVIIGFDDAIKALNYDEVIDLNGYHLYPGFVDSHLHIMGYGQMLSRPSLSGLMSCDDIIEKINKHPAHIIFEGYHHNVCDQDQLDRVFEDRPIVLRHADYHSASVNSVVLKAIGTTSDHGLLKEDDASKAMSYYEKHTTEALEMMFRLAIKQLYAYGLTGGHTEDLAYFNGFYGTYQAIKNTLMDMPFRAHLLINHHVLDDYLKADIGWLNINEYLQLGAIKIFYDGTFSSMTAKVSIPYKDHTYGRVILQDDELDQLFQKIRSYHLPVAIHVIGDVGLSEVFSWLKKHPVPKGLHDRMIHASMWQKKDLEIAKTLPLIFDIQPQFVSSDIPDVLSLFQSKPQTLYPWHTLLEEGFMLCGGSDAPVETPHPLLGRYDANYRETKEGVYDQKECLTRYEALKLYTINANIPTYDSHRGYLRKGYIADFTVLSRDILTIPKTQFKTNKIMMTIINEHIVYKG